MVYDANVLICLRLQNSILSLICRLIVFEKDRVEIKNKHQYSIIQSEEFLREAKVMMTLDHQCVVQLLGISHGPPVLMVLELVPLGKHADEVLVH